MGLGNTIRPVSHGSQNISEAFFMSFHQTPHLGLHFIPHYTMHLILQAKPLIG